MKKHIKKIGETMAAVPAVLLMIIIAVIILPFDFFKYQKSLYRKRERRKYYFLAASTTVFQIYKEIADNNLPIEYIKSPKAKTLIYDCFVCNGVLLVVDDFGFEFDKETGNWKYCVMGEREERTAVTLNEHIEQTVKEANDAIGENICNKAVILINSEESNDIDRLKDEPMFIVYKGDKDRLNALKAFCEYCNNQN